MTNRKDVFFTRIALVFILLLPLFFCIPVEAKQVEALSEKTHLTDEQRWRQYTERKPDLGEIKLTIGRKLLNLRDDMNVIYAYYQSREGDPFLLKKVRAQFSNRNSLRGLDLRKSQRSKLLLRDRGNHSDGTAGQA